MSLRAGARCFHHLFTPSLHHLHTISTPPPIHAQVLNVIRTVSPSPSPRETLATSWRTGARHYLFSHYAHHPLTIFMPWLYHVFFHHTTAFSHPSFERDSHLGSLSVPETSLAPPLNGNFGDVLTDWCPRISAIDYRSPIHTLHIHTRVHSPCTPFPRTLHTVLTPSRD